MTVERSKQESTSKSWAHTVATGTVSGMVRALLGWFITRWTE
ncbi:hypothetical protein [Streptomyces sp. SID3343]|nr:hypothetical protein [Streptomyces sp. SID3343]